MTDSAETTLQTLGENFIAYITASTPEIIHQRLTTASEQLSGDRENVLSEVAGFVQTLASTLEPSEPEMLLLHQITDMFGMFDEDESTTIANVFRKKSGGDIWQPASSDPVEQELLIQLRDVYPLLLLPDSSSPLLDTASFRLSGTLFRHPRRAR
jgi:hypothetical protein